VARSASKQCCASLRLRNSAPHTVENYGRELRRFFAPLAQAPRAVAGRDSAAFIQPPRQAPMSVATMHRRRNARKHFFAYLVREEPSLVSNPVTRSPVRRRGHPLPKPFAPDHGRPLCAHIPPPMEHALGLLMRRWGLRVSAVARLRLDDLDWTPPAFRIEPGKGRKERLLSLSTDARAALRTCLAIRPAAVPDGWVFWKQKRPQRALSAQGG
jgi:site-specific recombinase XerD